MEEKIFHRPPQFYQEGYYGHEYERDLFGKPEIQPGSPAWLALEEADQKQQVLDQLKRIITKRKMLLEERAAPVTEHRRAIVEQRESEIKELSRQMDELVRILLRAVYENYPLERAENPSAVFAKDLLIEMGDLAEEAGENVKFLFFNTIDTKLDQIGVDSFILIVDNEADMTYQGSQPLSVILDATLGSKEDSRAKIIVSEINPDPEGHEEEETYLQQVSALAKKIFARFQALSQRQVQKKAGARPAARRKWRGSMQQGDSWRAWDQPGGVE